VTILASAKRSSAVNGSRNEAKRIDMARKILRSRANARVTIWSELSVLLRDFNTGTALHLIRDAHSERNALTGQQRRPNDIIAIAADTWSDHVRDGQALADAIQSWASDRECMMVAIGEQAGQLADVLGRMAAAEKTMNRLRAAWIRSLRQPTILIIWGWATVPAYAWFLIYQLGQYPEIHNPWTLLALSIAHALLYWLSWVVPAIAIVAFIALRWITVRWFSPRRPDYEHIWPLSLHKAMAATDFLLALTTLTFAGYSKSRALKAMRVVSPPYLAWQIDALEEHTRSHKWGDALALADRRFPAAQENALMGIFSLNPATYPQQLDQITAEWIGKIEERLESNRQTTTTIAVIVVGILTVIGSLLVMATALPI
jgi:hypothetical protein